MRSLSGAQALEGACRFRSANEGGRQVFDHAHRMRVLGDAFPGIREVGAIGPVEDEGWDEVSPNLLVARSRGDCDDYCGDFWPW
ncbi:hypothetical protein [Streptomyces palmae]|uniref:Uncharacterized protein n=1 Tax=Streptomyces palmae TaxID=1701085 RepID=A0A4Z0HB64_9ACTN|nr:hypothetical protein [Streptomyces palmae]TGB15984.1 hypothetical protein E4099_05910 [Streptomyces palmae]